jgi:hypothetical protein
VKGPGEESALTRPPAAKNVEGSGVAMAMSTMAPAAWADTVGAPPIGNTTHGTSLSPREVLRAPWSHGWWTIQFEKKLWII